MAPDSLASWPGGFGLPDDEQLLVADRLKEHGHCFRIQPSAPVVPRSCAGGRGPRPLSPRRRLTSHVTRTSHNRRYVNPPAGGQRWSRSPDVGRLPRELQIWICVCARTRLYLRKVPPHTRGWTCSEHLSFTETCGSPGSLWVRSSMLLRRAGCRGTELTSETARRRRSL